MATAHAGSGFASGLSLACMVDGPWQLKVALAATCGGSALLPDLDAPGSTASRSLWLVTGALARLISGVSAWAYHATLGPRDDPSDEGTHRHLTHTWPGCAGLASIAAAITATDRRAAQIVLGLLAALGAAGAPVIGTGFTLATALIVGGLPGPVAEALASVHLGRFHIPNAGGWMDGIPHVEQLWPLWLATVMLGCVTHVVGDAITHYGCPMSWPFMVNGKRWGFYHLSPVTFRAGSWPEHLIVTPLILAGIALAGRYAFT